MTPRRARRAHNPTAAFWWGTAKWCALFGASAALGVALALVGGEAIFRGRWTVTGEAASVAFVGVVLGALAAVAHALMVHAIDGLASDPWACPECGTDAAGKCPTYCSRWEPVSDYDDDVLGFSDPGDLDEEDRQENEDEDARWFGGLS